MGKTQLPFNLIALEDEQFNAYFFNKANLPIVKGRVINADPSQLDTLTIKYIIQLPYSQKQVEKKM